MARSEADKAVDNTIESILKNQKEVKPKKLKMVEQEDDDKSSVAMFTSETLKLHVNKVMASIEKKDQANAAVKDAYDAAEKAGVPKAELKFLVKNRKKRLSEDFKANVNIMNEMLGELPLFKFVEKSDSPIIQHH